MQIEINNELEILDQWAKTWLVDFNPKKNKYSNSCVVQKNF
jgi:hypothetical protein